MDLPGPALITLHGLKQFRFLIAQFRSGASPRGRANSFIGDLKERSTCKRVLAGLFCGLPVQQICVAACVLLLVVLVLLKVHV